MRKNILTKKLARLQSKKQSLTERAMASQDVNEVRSINSELEDVNAEIAETQEELDAIEAEERAVELEAEKRAANPVPANAQRVNGDIAGATVGSFTTEARSDDEDRTASLEYRKAFKAYVQRGIPMPTEKRAGEAISTKDTGAAIPITVMNEVINTVRK